MGWNLFRRDVVMLGKKFHKLQRKITSLCFFLLLTKVYSITEQSSHILEEQLLNEQQEVSEILQLLDSIEIENEKSLNQQITRQELDIPLKNHPHVQKYIE